MRKPVVFLASLVLAASGCAVLDDGSGEEDPEVGSYEGVDEDPNQPLDDGKSDLPQYPIPTDLPHLVSPEIIVSLDGLTVHLFDRETGFQVVYPAGVGVKVNGRSITPRGHFKTGPSNTDLWWYAPRRTNPSYFAGLPFLRLTARNSRGENTYGMHGPITEELIRGYVSHGCIRMAKDDIIRLFWMIKPEHRSVPVTIQTEVELDAAGQRVDLGTTPTLWAVGEPIAFGASVGPRPL